MKFSSTLLAALSASFALTTTDAFSAHLKHSFVVPSQGLVSKSSLFMSEEDDGSYPSDSSAEEHYETVDVEAEDSPATAASKSVDTLMDVLPAEGTVLEISEETRTKINEALLKLEAMNPTEAPTKSGLLNGIWSLRYAGGYSSEGTLPSPTRQLALFLYSGGYSPGLFALSLAQKLPAGLVEVGDLEICIARSQPRVEASVNVKALGGADNKVVVKARLQSDSDVRFTETYESATVLEQNVAIPEPLQYSRDLYVTYLDEELLVIRDASGIPEVLVRK